MKKMEAFLFLFVLLLNNILFTQQKLKIMYYESRFNKIIKSKDDIQTIVKILKKLTIGEGLENNDVIYMNDESPSGTGALEIAVLVKTDGVYKQFESLTISWMDDEEIKNIISKFTNVKIIESNYDLKKLYIKSINDIHNIVF